jgi:hypothetical protein
MNYARYATLALTLAATFWPLAAAPPLSPSIGETIYRDGILPNGKPVVGARQRLPPLSGADAACVRCHRRSGIGSSEGRRSIPPITSPFLAQPRDDNRLTDDSQIAPGYNVSRLAFTDTTLARAIREGIVPGERGLSELMPRYQINDQAMAALIDYIKTLGSDPAPGLSAETLHLATIVTPDADPTARRGMLDVLTHYFAAPNPAFGEPRKMVHPDRIVGYRTRGPKWALHVWQLSGDPDTWEHQLSQRLAAEPVFAILSGLGRNEWGPVHRFCEREAIPCLLPNIDLPVVAEGDFYPVYFSRGVLLEAQLGAHWLARQRQGQDLKRVVQVYRSDDIGAAAASTMHALLSAAGFAVLDQSLAPGADRGQWLRAIEVAGASDGLVLWARKDDLEGLSDTPKVGTVLVSGLMAGLTGAQLPPAWRKQVRMTYPLDLPERSALRVATPRAWLIKNNILIVDERVQIDTYVACAAMSEIVGSLFDTYSRDLLIERFEDMMTTSTNPGRYPRLGLGQGQRFASKGGYIVRFATGGENEPIADGNWIVP